MHLLAFAATTSRRSINRQLVGHAVRVLEELAPGTTVEMLDIGELEMPIYSIDRQEEGGIPPEAHEFRAAIGRADAIVVSFAEHNGHYTAAYKNLFDWTSRLDREVFQGRPSVLLATAPGPGGGRNVLRAAVESAPFFGNEVVGSLAVPRFHEHFDTEAGRLTDPELDGQLRAAIAALVEAAGRAVA